ncbi:MAG: hypothetical protein ACLFVJ_23760, partial [Persicimonas sp.]
MRLDRASLRFSPRGEGASGLPTDADAVCICVPTPLNETRQPDLSYIQAALDMLQEHLQPPCLVVLESTTFPGTTDEIVAPQLWASSTRAVRGEDQGGAPSTRAVRGEDQGGAPSTRAVRGEDQGGAPSTR